jgi:hypothetical protein
MSNVIVRGFGYRRTGDVHRPVVTVITPLESNVQMNTLVVEVVVEPVVVLDVEVIQE